MVVVTSEQMQELDRRTIEDVGIPGAVLMENAGRGAFCALCRTFPDLDTRHVAVFCGRGNNGGDGLVIGRCLVQLGIAVDIYVIGSISRISGDGRISLGALQEAGVPLMEIGEGGLRVTDIPWSRYSLIIDALLGTGLKSEVHGVFRDLISAMNVCSAPVMAVDIPSGLSSDDGRVHGVAAEAALTVTFGLPKIGQFLYPGRTLCGELWVVDIGIPRRLVEKLSLGWRIVTPEDLRDILPPRRADAHKGHFGHVMVLAGSAGKTGAGVMTAEAALRVGAGLVTLGVPRSLNPAMESRLTEVMTLPLPDTSCQSFAKAARDDLLRALENKACLAIGPGVSGQEEASDLVREVIGRAGVPMVIDADGLNALAGHLDLLDSLETPCVLTPHPGEMARLLDRSIPEVQQDRPGAALELAERTGSYVLLKGAGTIMAHGNRVRFNPTGNPAMASGGAGDVLTGILAGLLAQGLEPMKALELGAYLHGWVADRWAEEIGGRGLMATDLLERIPPALEQILKGEVVRSWPRQTRECPFHV